MASRSKLARSGASLVERGISAPSDKARAGEQRRAPPTFGTSNSRFFEKVQVLNGVLQPSKPQQNLRAQQQQDSDPHPPVRSPFPPPRGAEEAASTHQPDGILGSYQRLVVFCI
ncbi:hypothetical protein PRIC1_002390 [Phytophthora ramorum]